MNRRLALLVALLFLGYCPPVPAQENGDTLAREYADGYFPVYPVREGHKWGYYAFLMDSFQLHIEPKFDVISAFPADWNVLGATRQSPYRLFEADGKVGLIDDQVNIIVANKYKRIRPLTTEYFAVEIDSLFTLGRRIGQTDSLEVIWPGRRYNDIYYAMAAGKEGEDYFLVKQSDYWGVRRMDGEIIVSPKFARLEPTNAPGYFKVKRLLNEGWGLNTPEDSVLLDYKYKEILVLDDNTFAAQPRNSDYWELIVFKKEWDDEAFYNELEKELKRLEGFMPAMHYLKTPYWKQTYKEIKPINKDLALVVREESKGGVTDFLYDVALDEELPYKEPYRTYAYFDEEHVLALRNKVDASRDTAGGPINFRPLSSRSEKAVLTNALEVVVAPGKYDEILPSGIPGLFKVHGNGRWGLLSAQEKEKMAVDYLYDEIYPFNEEGVALCRQQERTGGIIRRRYGALSWKNETINVIDCQFDTVYIGPGRVVALNYRTRDRLIFAIGEDGTFFRLDGLRNVVRDRVSGFKGWKEAEGDRIVPFEHKPGFHARGALRADSTLCREDGGYYRAKTRSAECNAVRYIDILQFGESAIALYRHDVPIDNAFTSAVIQKPLASVSLFDASQGRFLPAPTMAGFRLMGEDCPATAFLSPSGQMGLIGRDGKEVTKRDGSPLRYTYIGPFIAGYARVCKGGKLVWRQNAGWVGRFRIHRLSTFAKDFNLRGTSNLDQNFSDTEAWGIYAMADGMSEPRWGFINERGEEVVPPRYEYVQDYLETDSCAFILKARDSINVVDNVYFGLLDNRGREIIPPRYASIGFTHEYFVVSRASIPVFYYDNKGRQVFVNRTKPRPFSEGLSFFRDPGNGYWGYIDTLGTVVIRPQFKKASIFSGGLAKVVDTLGKVLFVGKNGEIAFSSPIPEKFWQSNLGVFSEGLCPVKKGARWGYLNSRGAYAVPCRFTQCTPFSHGAASVQVKERDASGPAVIDTAGNFLVQPGLYQRIGPFNSNGLAHYQDKEGQWGLLDTTGNPVMEARYAQIKDVEFPNGFARVMSGKRLWGLINLKGEEVLPPGYEAVDTVSEGMVAVRENLRFGGWEIYDLRRRKMLRGEYQEVAQFRGGYSLVREGRKRKVINRQGEEIPNQSGAFKFFSDGLFGMVGKDDKEYYADAYGNNAFFQDFKEVNPFAFGVAELTGNNGKKMAINRRGVVIVPPKYPFLRIDKNGFVRCNPQRFYGLYDREGNLLLEPEYDRIIAYKDWRGEYNGLLRVECGESVGYFRLEKNKVRELWKLQN